MIAYPKNIKSQIDHPLDISKAVDFTNQLIADNYLGPNNSQLCITSRKNSTNPLYEGAGRAIYPESEFNTINNLFQDSVFDHLLQNTTWKYGRARLMYLEPRKSYSIHRDETQRIHYAIITNPQAILLVEHSETLMWKIHIPANGLGYKINTTLPHTAINGGIEPRIHLLINLI